MGLFDWSANIFCFFGLVCNSSLAGRVDLIRFIHYCALGDSWARLGVLYVAIWCERDFLPGKMIAG